MLIDSGQAEGERAVLPQTGLSASTLFAVRVHHHACRQQSIHDAPLCRSWRLLACMSSGSQAGGPAGGYGPGAAAEGVGRVRSSWKRPGIVYRRVADDVRGFGGLRLLIVTGAVGLGACRVCLMQI